jgi:hypothetical protein
VYIQLESIGLSRGVPMLLRWLINPIIKRIRRESLFRLLKSTRTALTNKSAAAARLPPPNIIRPTGWGWIHRLPRVPRPRPTPVSPCDSCFPYIQPLLPIPPPPHELPGVG